MSMGDDSSRIVFANARLVLPDKVVSGSVVVENGRIRSVTEGDAEPHAGTARRIDARGLYLSPGFVDIHTHGAAGADFMDGTEEAVRGICAAHLEHGTTSIVPTTLTSVFDEMLAVVGLIERIQAETRGLGRAGACLPEILGIHVEGPYFSPEQKGAQDPRYLKSPDPAEYERALDEHPGIVRWTVAPELPGALDMGRELGRRGVVASIGHSDAAYEQVVEACASGYRLVTHLYNGMSRLARRNAIWIPGVVESALLLDELDVEVIADGMHLPPSLLALVFKVKGPDHICLVTDSMRAAGQDVTESILGSVKDGRKVLVQDGVAWLPDKSFFAGSIATTDRLVRTMTRSVGVPVHEAVRMMSLTPARVMGVQGRKGSLEPGKDADIVLFDDDVTMRLVMIRGRVCRADPPFRA